MDHNTPDELGMKNGNDINIVNLSQNSKFTVSTSLYNTSLRQEAIFNFSKSSNYRKDFLKKMRKDERQEEINKRRFKTNKKIYAQPDETGILMYKIKYSVVM